jgi:hypothetical protein
MFETLHNYQRVCFVVIVVLVALLIFFCLAVKSAKGEEIATIKDGHLIISETKQIADIPEVPKGLRNDANTALKLYKGELKEQKVFSSISKTKIYFSFPCFVINEMAQSKKGISFSQGGWKIKELEPDILKSQGPETFFFIIIPVVLILIVSLGNQLRNQGRNKLFVFFGVVLLSALLPSTLHSLGVKGNALGVVGLLVFVVAVGVAGEKAADFILSPFLSGILGVLVFLIAVLLSENHKMPWNFLIFLAIAELACFAIACWLSHHVWVWLLSDERKQAPKSKKRFFEAG